MKEEHKINGTYLVADVIWGVTIQETISDPDIEILDAHTFYESLADLYENEIIYTHMGGADEDLFDKIDEEYGIKV
jgi:hypothetical protein